MYRYIYIYICVCTCIHIHTHMYIYIYIYTGVCGLIATPQEIEQFKQLDIGTTSSNPGNKFLSTHVTRLGAAPPVPLPEATAEDETSPWNRSNWWFNNLIPTCWFNLRKMLVSTWKMAIHFMWFHQQHWGFHRIQPSMRSVFLGGFHCQTYDNGEIIDDLAGMMMWFDWYPHA